MKLLRFSSIFTYTFTRAFNLNEIKDFDKLTIEQKMSRQLLDCFDGDNKIHGQLALQDALLEFKFSPCLPNEGKKTGWSPIYHDDKNDSPALVDFVGDHVLMFYKEERREIPKDELRRKLEERTEAYALEHGKLPNKEQTIAIQDALYLEMLPHAYSKFIVTPVWIDLKEQRLIVSAGSSSKAEVPISYLRKTLGSLPVVPFCSSAKKPELIMTQWVQSSKAPQNFEFGHEVKVEFLDQDGSILFKDKPLTDQDIVDAVNNNGEVTKIALLFGEEVEAPIDISIPPELNPEDNIPPPQFTEHMRFMLSSGLNLKMIKYGDFIFDGETYDPEDTRVLLISTFAIIAGQLSQLLNELSIVFGLERDDV